MRMRIETPRHRVRSVLYSALLRSAALPLVLSLLSLGVAHASESVAERERSPVAVCYPVAGTGRILGRSTCTPIGALSPVFEGDTVLVQQGQVTLVDVRSGARRQIAAHDAFVVPRTRGRVERGHWERLRELLADCLRGPGLHGEGGSVRGEAACFWPDTVRSADDLPRFAAGVPLNFEWCGSRLAPRTLRISWSRSDTVRVELDAASIAMSGVEWPAGVPKREGRARWSLLDAEGHRLGGGRFEILSDAAADAARARFNDAARTVRFEAEATLGAALLAAAEHYYLW